MLIDMWNYAIKAPNLADATDFYVKCMGAELRLSGEVLAATTRGANHGAPLG